MIHTFNANLSWRRLVEYLEHDVASHIEDGAIPIVACQEHGQRGPWLVEGTAALAKKGWHVVAAPAQATEAGGTSVGGLLAFPECLGICKAHSQQAWDISPAGAAGRLVLALVEVKAIGRLAVFSAYFWADKNLCFAGNLALLEAIVIWTQRLGLPWVVAADWQISHRTWRAHHGTRRLWLSSWLGKALGAHAGPERLRGSLTSFGHPGPWQECWRGPSWTWRPRMRLTGPLGSKPRAVGRPTGSGCPALQSSSLWRPSGCMGPPPVYPKKESIQANQVGLDQAWHSFCQLAEQEISGILG